MQQLLNICHTYSTEHSLLYNGNKSFSMCFKPSTIKFTRPWFFLAGMKIPIVTHCKYLGVIMSEHNSAGASPGFGRGGAKNFFFRFGNLHVAKGVRGHAPRENFLKRCNLVRFRVYFDQILSLFFSKNAIFYIKKKF